MKNSITSAIAVALFSASAQAQLVTKIADDFEQAAWQLGQYTMAPGSVAVVDERAPGAQSAHSMRITGNFSESFGGLILEPVEPLVIPGESKKITLHTRIGDKRFGLRVNFRDGWGREQSGGKPMEWNLKTDPAGGWQTETFTVPADWVQPITISAFSSNNWEARGSNVDLSIWVDELTVETDLSNVDQASGALKTWKPDPAPADAKKTPKQSPAVPLVGVSISTPEIGNVFTEAAPTASVRIRNWKSGALTGTASYTLLSNTGEELDRGEQKVSFESIAGMNLPLKADRFGRYVLKANVTLSDGTKTEEQLALAKLPVPRNLTEEQKVASPYGLNYHGGAGLMLSPFRRAGLVWYREYAFQWDWLVRAKGADRSYAGWPNFQGIVKAYETAGAKILPVLQRSITAPKVQDGKIVGPIGPDAQWTRELVSLMGAFPQITHWEMNNEYDLNKENATAEELCNWENYGKYHAALGSAVKLMGGGKWVAVENGRAGVWPDRVEAMVRSGDFADIQVVNSHHYTGVDAPELNHGNFNTGFAGGGAEKPMLFYDQLRDAKRAGQVDGKKREHWLTEFGWDTKAGHIVSPYEQAVFLPRGWMLSMAAGCEKAFWFFHFDSNEANNFFDGCGLMSFKREPKLSLSSMAGLSWVLPNPKYIGMLDAGENTGGYIFEQDGKLVASLFALKGDDGPTVRLQAEKIYDYLGNAIGGSDVKLTMAPLYAVGVNKSSSWYAQTAYELETPYMVVSASGDSATAVLVVNNNRDRAIEGEAKLVLPEGWTSAAPTVKFAAPAGQVQRVPLSFLVAGGESLGMKEVKLQISEQKHVKDIRLKVLVQPPVALAVGPLQGRPGETSVTARVANRSLSQRSGLLKLQLPSSWKAAQPSVEVADLKPGEMREIQLDLTWASNWGTGETASVMFDGGSGVQASQPIIPNTYVLHQAKGLRMDGDLADWPANSELPNWMLGSTVGQPQARVFAAWSPEGIYGAIEVKDAKMKNLDARSFWQGEVLEMFIDTADNKEHRFFEAGDHQFWFVPQPAENRVFVGQWKSKEEIPETRFDIAGVKSAAKQQGNGYVMEFLLPAEHLQKYQAKVGAKLGLNVNLTVRGERFTREVFWPRAKEWIVNNLPKTWGTVELVD